MSITALAIRTCAFLALYRRTIAEDRVYESAITPLDDQIKDQTAPFVTVSVDEASGSPDLAKSLLDATQNLILVIQFAIGQSVTVTGANGQTETVVQVPATDPALEWSLDILSTQIKARLSADPIWGDLWRRLVLSVNRFAALRDANAEGTRYASRQLLIDVQPIADPAFGGVPEAGTPIADFLLALRAIPSDPLFGSDPELAIYPGLADAIEAAMRAPDDMASWQVIAAHLGVADEVVSAIGLGPQPPETVQTPDLSTIAIYGDEIDEDRIDETVEPLPDAP